VPGLTPNFCCSSHCPNCWFHRFCLLDTWLSQFNYKCLL